MHSKVHCYKCNQMVDAADVVVQTDATGRKRKVCTGCANRRQAHLAHVRSPGGTAASRR